MKAVQVTRFGGPEVLEIADVAVPEPGPGEVRIRVEASAVNPADLGTRSGALAEAGLLVPNGPVGIGWDAAGRIDAIGDGVHEFAVGDRVLGLRDRLPAPIGAQAEQLVLDVGAVGAAPRSASAAEGATLPLNGLAAAQALDLIDLPPGSWLLVTGAAGGLGGFIVELAALRGLRPIGVAGAADEELVRRLGAEAFVDRDEPLAPAVRRIVPGGADGAIDAAVVGMAALDAVRNGGAFIACVVGGGPVPLRGTRVENVWIRADGPRLTELSALVDAGRLTLRVADVQPLEQVAQAHERLAAGGLRGRIVLDVAA